MQNDETTMPDDEAPVSPPQEAYLVWGEDGWRMSKASDPYAVRFVREVATGEALQAELRALESTEERDTRLRTLRACEERMLLTLADAYVQVSPEAITKAIEASHEWAANGPEDNDLLWFAHDMVVPLERGFHATAGEIESLLGMAYQSARNALRPLDGEPEEEEA